MLLYMIFGNQRVYLIKDWVLLKIVKNKQTSKTWICNISKGAEFFQQDKYNVITVK